MAADERGPWQFPTTPWSLVAIAGRAGQQGAREALGELLTRYLPAVRAHLVYGKGMPPDGADDLIQEFVANKILERQLIAKANRELGKFRTFLLTSLDRFLINRVRDGRARKRAAGDAAQPLGDRAERLADEAGASRAYDVAWARSVLGQALESMRCECQQGGREELWELFQARVVGPLLHGARPLQYGELVARFGFQSPAQASNLLATAKRMYARVLRRVIGEYARDSTEVDEEIRELHGALAQARRGAAPLEPS